jgi:hypothetical protein
MRIRLVLDIQDDAPNIFRETEMNMREMEIENNSKCLYPQRSNLRLDENRGNGGDFEHGGCLSMLFE